MDSTFTQDSVGRRSRGEPGEASWALTRVPSDRIEDGPPRGRPDAPNDGVPQEIAALLGDTPPEGPSFSARLCPTRLARGLWARRYTALIVWAIVTAITVGLVASLVQRHWQAVTTLMMRQDVEQLSVGGGKPYQVPEYRLETLLDTLKLPSSLAAAATAAGVDTDPTTLAGAVDVSVARNSDVLNLKVLWSDAESAARLANALASVFVERSLRIRVDEAQEDLDRYTLQLQDARTRVQRADADVLAFQQAHQVSDFEEETKARLIDLSRLEAEHRTVVAEVDGLQTARDELRAAIAEQPETVVSSTLFRNPLKKRLEEFRWELKEARSRYTSSNPKVVKLEREISALEEVLRDGGEQSAPERTDGPNQLRQDMQLRLHELNDEIRKAQGRASGLATSVQSTLAKLAYLSAREKEYAALKANQDAARQLEASLAAKAEEARVAASSGEAAFQILEPAATPVQPAPSGRKLMVGAGAMFGLFLGLFIAMLVEIVDPTIRDRADLVALVDDATTSGFPAIDRISPHRVMDRAAQRWRRLVNDLETGEGRPALAVVSLDSREPRPIAAWNLAVTYAAKGVETVIASDHDTEVDSREPRPTRLREVPGPRSELSASATTGEVSAWLDRVARRSGKAIVEVPSLSDDETAMELATAIGSVILVAKSGVTDRRQAEELVARLRSQGAEVVGAIVTDLPPERQPDARPFSLAGSSPWPALRAVFRRPSEVQHA